MNYDIVTFGETMLRMSPPGHTRIEQTNSFDTYVAGSESNTAVGLARLGANVNWFSRLPDSSLGKLVANRIREQGVDVSHVIYAEAERLGLYYLEISSIPRPTQAIYDRANSAMSAIQPDDLPVEIFQKGKAKLLHTSGITLAISQSSANTAIRAIDMAKEAGWQVSFDVNYRSKLWSSDAALAGCTPCLAKADIIFVPLRDARLLFDYPDIMPATDILLNLHERFPHANIVMSRGHEGSMCCSSDGEVFSQEAFSVEGQYRIGAGDSFSAGFLYSYVCREDTPDTALSWGNAVAALKFTIPGDMPLIDREHVESLLQNKSGANLIR